MTIQEQIYNRFLKALTTLKNFEKIKENIFKDVAKTYLDEKNISLTKLSIKLNESDFLVKVAIITALMEASNNWKEFEDLHKKQKANEKSSTPQPTNTPELNDFDKILKGILQVPKPKEEKT